MSVIIPTKNEEKYISGCVESLEQSDYPNDKFELMIVDGGSSDRSIEVVESLQRKYGNIRLFCNAGANTSVSRNIGINNACGDAIFNFSSHAIAQKNTIRILATKLQHSQKNVMGVGCKDKKPTTQSSVIANSINDITSTFIGGKMMHQQMDVKGEKFVDSISFTVYKREIFEKIGFFDASLPSGDDAELNFRIKKAGYKLLQTSETCVYRYRRENLNAFFWQMMNYGRSRIRVCKKHLNSTRLAYLIPAIFVAYLAAFLPIILLQNNFLFFLWNLGFIFYLVLLFASSIKLAIFKKNLSLLLIGPILYFLEHFAYGLGIILGLFPKKEYNKKGE